MKYQHIVAAVDVYEQTQAALERAVAFAKKYNSELEIIHVLPPVLTNAPYAMEFQTNIQDEAKVRLEGIAKMAAVGDAKTHTILGSPGREIARLSKKLNADLIVVGSHGKHGVDLLLGSTANALVHHAKCDVLTVRVNQEDKALKTGPYRKILLATDLNEDNHIVIEKAYALAKENDAELYIINVVPDTPAMASVYIPNVELDLKKHAEEVMAGVVKELNINASHALVKIGFPSHDILAYATEVAADLIVMGSHGPKLLKSILLGSTANAVLHGAKTDVLIVRL